MASHEFDFGRFRRSSAVFEKLPTDAVRELFAKGRIERYATRSLLVAQGIVPDHFRYVLEGHNDLTLSTPGGRYTTLPITSGQWATWLGCFSDRPLQHEMWSCKGAVHFALPRQAVRAAVDVSPEALLAVIEHIGETTRFLVAWTLGATLLAPEKRLAFLLLAAIGRETLSSAGEHEASLTQEQIGHLGFGSRQRVGRLLQALEAEGLVETRYGAILVPSRERLNAYVFV